MSRCACQRLAEAGWAINCQACGATGLVEQSKGWTVVACVALVVSVCAWLVFAGRLAVTIAGLA